MTVADAKSHLFRPPAPTPRSKPATPLETIYALWRNPLEVWSKAHFEKPVLIGKSFLGVRAVINDPAAVRRVFLDNAANYRKDALQLRILRPGLGTGLLTVEGENWKSQRRALAPLFSPRQVADFAPAMQRVASAMVDRLAVGRDGRPLDIAPEMARVTLEAADRIGRQRR